MHELRGAFEKRRSEYDEKRKSEKALVKTLQKHLSTDIAQRFLHLEKEPSKELMERREKSAELGETCVDMWM